MIPMPVYHPLKALVTQEDVMQEHRRRRPVHPKYQRRRIIWSGILLFVLSACAVFGLGMLYGKRLSDIGTIILVISLALVAVVLIVSEDIRQRRAKNTGRDQRHHFWNRGR